MPNGPTEDDALDMRIADLMEARNRFAPPREADGHAATAWASRETYSRLRDRSEQHRSAWKATPQKQQGDPS